MTGEELSRKFDFIVEQLGQTVVGLQMMKEVHEADYQKFDKRMSRLEGAFVGIYNTVLSNLNRLKACVQLLNSFARKALRLASGSIFLLSFSKNLFPKIRTATARPKIKT